MRTFRITTIGIVLLGIGSLSSSMGQQLPAPSPPWASRMPEPQKSDGSQQAQQEKMQIAAQQKRLAADTERLLVLTTELKEQVDKSPKDTLSVDVIKKMDEIAKLAHRMRQRMKH
jgi:hypothetical protein